MSARGEQGCEGCVADAEEESVKFQNRYLFGWCARQSLGVGGGGGGRGMENVILVAAGIVRDSEAWVEVLSRVSRRHPLSKPQMLTDIVHQLPGTCPD